MSRFKSVIISHHHKDFQHPLQLRMEKGSCPGRSQEEQVGEYGGCLQLQPLPWIQTLTFFLFVVRRRGQWIRKSHISDRKSEPRQGGQHWLTGLPRGCWHEKSRWYKEALYRILHIPGSQWSLDYGKEAWQVQRARVPGPASETWGEEEGQGL